jgi:hypothetical protein
MISLQGATIQALRIWIWVVQFTNRGILQDKRQGGCTQTHDALWPDSATPWITTTELQQGRSTHIPESIGRIWEKVAESWCSCCNSWVSNFQLGIIVDHLEFSKDTWYYTLPKWESQMTWKICPTQWKSHLKGSSGE